MATVTKPPIADASLVHNGIAGIALTGDRIRATIFPDAGGKIADLVHLPSGYDLLWKNPRVPLRATYPGASFDDVWSGGWDELFPTDPPCVVGDNAFHDHGDLWCGPWDWHVTADDGETATVHLQRDAMSLPCRFEKEVTLRRDSLELEVRHRLTNLGVQPVPYTWSIHVAHAIGPGSRFHLPATRVGAAPPMRSRFGDAVHELAWPVHDGVDLAATLAAEEGRTEWFHTLDQRDGWCAVTHPSPGVGLALSYDPELFRTTWTWGVYGGWRGHYVLLTEPSTSPPGGLAAAVAAGTEAVLGPNEVLETTVVATVLEGVGAAGPGDELPEGAATRRYPPRGAPIG